MRIGDNPERDTKVEIASCDHRVIIPYYIASEKTYFENTFQIFKNCIKSLTGNSKYNLVITVICNGGRSKEVEDEVYQWYNEGILDEIIFVNSKVGKINAILKALRSTRESLVTVTDADVLFLKDWDKAVFEIFDSFPKAAAVSPTPIFRTEKRLTYNIWFDYIFSNRLKFRKVKDPEAMTRFANSIGWSRLDKKYKDVILTLEASNGKIGVVGNSHFCVTYNSWVFQSLPYENSEYLIGGNSELKYLDLPPVKCDGYRLATYENYAYHMGNKLENWMLQELERIEFQEKINYSPNIIPLKFQPFNYFLKQKVFPKFFIIPFIQKWIFKRKGLSDEKINDYFF